VAGLAAGFRVAPIARASTPVAEAVARLSSQASRRRIQALHPLPVLARATGPVSAAAVAGAASGCAASR
jgi:hypothetical protein